jgi:molybdopterin molybdotransferase
MPQYLKLQPPFIARDNFLNQIPPTPPPSEFCPTAESLGRVLAEDIYASHPLPQFARSTVDGYAVHSVETYGASESLPAILRLSGEAPMGKTAAQPVLAGEAILIHTGGMLPPGADAVVMLEQTQLTGSDSLEIYRPVAVNENVILVGEDVQTGELVIPAGRRIRPVELGGLMSFGLTQVKVNRAPRVGILSSGDEIVQPDDTPQPGQVRDINTSTMSAIVSEAGGLPVPYPIIPDDPVALYQAVARAHAENDMVLITAGSSASTRDLTSEIVAQLGAPGILAHGVNVRPGKPTILAVCDGKPVIGLPGNPVSALVISAIFAKPAIHKLLGCTDPVFQPTVSARLTAPVSSQAGREDWVPVILQASPEGYLAEPIFFKSNLIFNLVRANGLLHIDADTTGLTAGEMAAIEIL